MIISKIAGKAQTTNPLAVKALGLTESGWVSYVIEGDQVILRRLTGQAEPDPFAGFGEWAFEADCAAHADL